MACIELSQLRRLFSLNASQPGSIPILLVPETCLPWNYIQMHRLVLWFGGVYMYGNKLTEQKIDACLNLDTFVQK